MEIITLTTPRPHNNSGDEAPKVAAFKEALGLDDEAAAPVFIEVRAAATQ